MKLCSFPKVGGIGWVISKQRIEVRGPDSRPFTYTHAQKKKKKKSLRSS